MIQETSIESYANLLESLGSRQLVVLTAISRIEPCNNTQIAKFLNLPINCITGRVNELRKKRLVKLSKVDECPITSRKSMFWERIKQ